MMMMVMMILLMMMMVMMIMDRFLPDDLTDFYLGHITRNSCVFANLVFTHEEVIDFYRFLK